MLLEGNTAPARWLVDEKAQAIKDIFWILISKKLNH